MATYTEIESNLTIYNRSFGVQWDEGATVWDTADNIIQTYWDIVEQNYTESANNATTWTPA